MDHRYLIDRIRSELAEVLDGDIESIQSDADLRELGIDSLAAIELASRLRDNLDIHFGLLTLVQNSTVKDLADLAGRTGRVINRKLKD